jgi:hypothetical protein
MVTAGKARAVGSAQVCRRSPLSMWSIHSLLAAEIIRPTSGGGS